MNVTHKKTITFELNEAEAEALKLFILAAANKDIFDETAQDILDEINDWQ